MLLLNTARTITVDGVTVLPDHADPDQFWYLPGPVSLAQREDGSRAFTFIAVKPGAVKDNAKGGGFVMFTTCLRLNPQTEQRIMSRLGALARGTPKLALAQFDQGSVKVVALNLEGSGGTAAGTPPPGAFNAVEKVLGAAIPSMQGTEEAAFSLVLSQEGATILRQAFQQGATPIGVIYDLKFTGLRPNLNVKITADFKRVYDGLSAGLSAQYYFVSAGIDAAFEKLKQDGAIKIQVTDFTGAEDRDEKEKWALDFFKEDLLAKWFEPTLTPGVAKVTTPSAADTPFPKPDSGGSQPAASPAPSQAPGATKPPASTAAPAVSPSVAPAGTTTPTPTPAPPATPATPLARLKITARDPDPSPAGIDITHTPSPSGTQETLVFKGGDAPPQVKIDDGAFQTLTTDRQMSINVEPGKTHTITARWPNQTKPDVFNLFFSFEKPRAEGFSASDTNALFKSYMLGSVSDDPIFSRNHRPGSTATNQVQALRDFLKTVPPDSSGKKVVDVDAHASFEGDDTKGERNSALSTRRLDVARGLLRQADPNHRLGNGGIFLGFKEARDAGRVSEPKDNADGSPNIDRVAKIHSSAAAKDVTITATIQRDAVTTPPPVTTTPPPVTTTPPPVTTTPPPATTTPPPGSTAPPASTQPPGTTPDPTKKPPSGKIEGSPSVAFRLKFVHQEELKTLSLEYNRQDATQRTYAPQGFFGLMLQDLQDSAKLFVEVDLDDPFFRTMAVDASMPIDFNKIGLNSAHVALDYGDPADAQNHRHSDFVFSPQDKSDKRFEFFLNKLLETTYRFAVDFNFDPQSPWLAERFSYHFGPTATDNRNLFVNPFENLGFLEVTLFPHEVDAAVVDSIDVSIQALKPDLTPDGPEKIFHVLPDSAEQVFRFRSDDPQVVSYRHQFTTLLKDGTTRQSEPKISRASRLAVNDPFDDALVIELVPLFDQNAIRTVFIDIEYDDDPNNYHRRERITMEGAAQRSTLRLALMDKKLRVFRFRFTFVGTNNQIQAGAFQETKETILAVAPQP